MKKKISFLLVLTMVLMLIPAFSVTAFAGEEETKNFTVTKSTKDSGSFDDLQDALDYADNGSFITLNTECYLLSGGYTITKSVTIAAISHGYFASDVYDTEAVEKVDDTLFTITSGATVAFSELDFTFVELSDDGDDFIRVIDSNLNIEGCSFYGCKTKGNFIDISGNSDVTLIDSNIQDAEVSGGIIVGNGNELTLNHVGIGNCIASSGELVYSKGALTVSASTFEENKACGKGLIYSDGVTTFEGRYTTEISENTVDADADAAILYVNNNLSTKNLEIKDNLITQHESDIASAGIYVPSGCLADITATDISGNCYTSDKDGNNCVDTIYISSGSTVSWGDGNSAIGSYINKSGSKLNITDGYYSIDFEVELADGYTLHTRTYSQREYKVVQIDPDLADISVMWLDPYVTVQGDDAELKEILEASVVDLIPDIKDMANTTMYLMPRDGSYAAAKAKLEAQPGIVTPAAIVIDMHTDITIEDVVRTGGEITSFKLRLDPNYSLYLTSNQDISSIDFYADSIFYTDDATPFDTIEYVDRANLPMIGYDYVSIGIPSSMAVPVEGSSDSFMDCYRTAAMIYSPYYDPEDDDECRCTVYYDSDADKYYANYVEWELSPYMQFEFYKKSRIVAGYMVNTYFQMQYAYNDVEENYNNYQDNLDSFYDYERDIIYLLNNCNQDIKATTPFKFRILATEPGYEYTGKVTCDGYIAIRTVSQVDALDDEYEPTGEKLNCYTYTFIPTSSSDDGGTSSVSTPAPATNKIAFTDVNEKAYYYDAVKWAAEKGITSGKTETTFAPNDTCTRSEFVTFLWRAAGQPIVNYLMPFTDINEDSYYGEALRWAASEGIVKGATATTFNPGGTITRAQAAAYLYRYAKAPAIANMTANGPAPSPFGDVDGAAYYYDAVLWAKAQGITSGKTETTFGPNDNCLRGQMAVFLYKYFAK